MTGDRSIRLGGRCLAAGAALFTVHVVWRSVVTAALDPVAAAVSGGWAPLNAMGTAGAVLVLLGLPALHAWLAERASAAVAVGIALLTTAWLFFGFFLSLHALLVMPWLAVQAPALVAGSVPLPAAMVVAFVVAIAAWLAGAALLAIPFLRRKAAPRWVGYLLPLSAVWLLVGSFVLAPGGPSRDLGVNLASNLGPIFLMTALGYLGWRMQLGRVPSAS